MELYNDLKISGKGLYNPINDDNIYTNQGIIFNLINSNQDLSINADNNYLNFSIYPTSVNINFNQQFSLNNILNISSNSNIGIGKTNPNCLLDVAGSISCLDININNSILNKDIIKNIGISATNFNNGILNINNGGTGTNIYNQEQLIFGNIQQSSFLIWKNDEKKLGIGLNNPYYNLDISNDINAIYYRIDGNDINNIFIKDLSFTSNECFINSSNMTLLSSIDYTNNIGNYVNNVIDSRTVDWVKNGKLINYIESSVGIGTTKPISKLHVMGDINLTGNLRKNGVLNKLFFGDYSDLYNNPGYTWDISNGNIYNLNLSTVGIGTNIPLYKLDINGSINYTKDIRKNGNIITIFNGNYNNLINKPLFSTFAKSGSYYDLYDIPYIFDGKYSSLTDTPTIYPTNWNTHISNLPNFFNTEWNNTIINKPNYFLTDWNTSITNKPTYFNVEWNSNICGKPDYYIADWNTSIINKPNIYYSDWFSNIYNKPNFSKFSVTGDFKDLLNKPYIFNGIYSNLLEKPSFAVVAYTGDYNHLSNLPKIFSGDFNELSNIPTYFKSDWNLNIANKPELSPISKTGIFNDLIGNIPIKNWGDKGDNIYNCNLGYNIGIGITNPSFNLDIKGNININNEILIDDNENITLKNNKPWGIYLAEDWSNNTLYDSSGNGRDAITSGNINIKQESGNGADGNITYIYGGTDTKVIWPSGSIPGNFTILSLTRYNGGSKARILSQNNDIGNFLHGHWNGNRGVCHYDSWKTYPYRTDNIENWLCCIGKNSYSTPNNILLDGIASGSDNGGNGNYTLAINNNWGENSDWALSCVIIWDYHLTDDDCFDLNNMIKFFLNKGGLFKKLIKNTILIDNYCYLNYNNNNFLNSNDYYRTSNWVINENNIYNVNSGSIGINNINPSSSYKLDVNGIINTTTNYSLVNNLSWSSYNSSIESRDYILYIKSSINKKLILNNNLFINSGKIGIGTTNPSSIIHLHNPNLNQEVKLSLSTTFSLFKKINNEGIIWNSDKGVKFGINNIERLSLCSTEILSPSDSTQLTNNGRKINIDINSTSTTLNLNNSLLNQEIKLNLTDSTYNNNLTIYKSINNDGFFWNIQNNNLIFGTNNKEYFRLTNQNFIGIGTNNPSSIIHLHNPQSNQIVKLSLSNSFFIYKDTNNDAIINNSNNGIKFGTNNIERLSLCCTTDNFQPWGIYFAGNYSNNTLYDLSGNGRHAITSGTINSNIGNGNGAIGNITYLSGNTSSTILWPSGSIPSNFTILSLTRYTGGTSKRILQSSYSIFGIGWAHGHNDNKRGVAYYEDLNTEQTSINPINNWLCFIGKNSTNTPNNILVDNIPSGKTGGGFGGGDYRLSINYVNKDWRYRSDYIDNNSDWALSYVVIWDRHLSDEEMFYQSSLIMNYLNTGDSTLLTNNSGKINIDINSISTTLNLNNLSANQEIKLNLTDNTYTFINYYTNNLTIYKSINNDGYFWNIQNNNLIFGTNNREYFRLINENFTGIYRNFIGIGTNNPSSIIHLHNPQSNQIVKLSLSNSFFIYKDTNNDAIINNSNNGIKFGTNNIERLSLCCTTDNFQPWGIYFAGNYSNNTLYDLSGNGRHAITSGTITSNIGNGNGAIGNITYISGNTSSSVLWPLGSIPRTFTILSLTRYTGGTNKRILQSSYPIYTEDWVHGHDDNKRGVAYYGVWKTNQISINPIDNWLCFIGKNSTNPPYNILIDDIPSGISEYRWGIGDGGIYSLSINDETYYKNKSSDWALSYVVIWDRHLSDEEMFYNSKLLTNYLKSGNPAPLFVNINGGKINIDINSTSTTLNLNNPLSNQEINLNLKGNDYNHIIIYKSINNDGYILTTNQYNANLLYFGTNNNQVLTITTTGNIGIGTINNNNNYILYINGTINGLIQTSSEQIYNLDISKFNSGTLKIINGGLNTSNLIQNKLLIGTGTNDIGQISDIIWMNNRLGIGSADPQNALDINGTITGNFFQGNGNSVTNINIRNFSGTLNIINGGTYRNNLTLGQILIGNGNLAIHQTNNLYWSDNKLGILKTNQNKTLDVNGDINGIFYGDGTYITNLNTNYLSDILNINNGGTGTTSFVSNLLLIGNGTSSITQTNQLFWNNTSNRLGININPQYNLDINGDLKSLTINGSGTDIRNLNINKITSGILNINTGGFGKNTLSSNNILVGNGLNALNQTDKLLFNDNKLIINAVANNFTNITNNLTINGDVNFTGNLRQNGNIYRGTGAQKGEWNDSYAYNTSGTIIYNAIYYNLGTVGIGTENPNTSYKLDVSGKIITNENGININEITILKSNCLILKNNNNNLYDSKILFNNDNKIEHSNNMFTLNIKLNDTLTNNGFYFKNGNIIIFKDNSTDDYNIPLKIYTSNYNIYITEDEIINIDGTNNYIYYVYNKPRYRYANFINSGTIRFKYNLTAEVLIVGGGGCGGGNNPSYAYNNVSAAGGGGGGVGIGTINFKKDITYNISIGSGGQFDITNFRSTNGNDTTIIGGLINETAYGGGGGGAFTNAQWQRDAGIHNGQSGGSSGGASRNGSSGTATKGISSSSINSSIVYYGNIGGLNRLVGSTNYAGGGGGAGYQGNYKYINSTYVFKDGYGGEGKISSITGISNYYGGGGTAGNADITEDGLGGGGNYYRKSGIINTGGGGCGSVYSLPEQPGNGGSGLVIIRYNYLGTLNKSYNSAYFMNNIVVKGALVSSSDKRIKKNIKDINKKKSLNLISKINPKSFNYIDIIDKGTKNNYGFIAQDIKEIFPEAVELKKDFIPNIMKIFNIKNDIIETDEDLTDKLFINDKIQIIDKENNREDYKILEISSNHIKIDKKINDNNCFIYGKEIDDFHILDKKIIYTLNVSATQQINKKINKYKKQIKEQELILKEHELILKEQELKFEEQEKQLKYLFINYY